MILCFGANLGYKDLKAFILSDNLASILENLTIIEKKISNDLFLGHIKEV